MASTDAGRTLTVAHRRQQQTLRAATLRDLLRVWRGVDPTNLKGTISPFAQTAAILIAARFADSAGLAVQYFQDFRRAEGVSGTAFIERPDPPDSEKLVGTVRGAGLTGIVNARRAGFPVQAAADQGFVKVAGSAAALVLLGGRQVITEAAVGDRKARGWQRVTSGENCDFCSSLAGTLQSSPGDFPAHDHCDCSAEPVYESS